MSKYDEDLIKKTIDSFIARHFSGNFPVTIMFDADNTLYKFSTFNQIDTSLREMYSKGFFKQLPIFPEAPTVITNLMQLGFKCGILTSAIDSPYCVEEKMESFHYYFPMIEDENIHILKPDESKVERFGDVRDIVLVDDYHKNIMDWYEAGGVAIKKNYSGKQRPVPVVTSLIDLFYVLYRLGAY